MYDRNKLIKKTAYNLFFYLLLIIFFGISIFKSRYEYLNIVFIILFICSTVVFIKTIFQFKSLLNDDLNYLKIDNSFKRYQDYFVWGIWFAGIVLFDIIAIINWGDGGKINFWLSFVFLLIFICGVKDDLKKK